MGGSFAPVPVAAFTWNGWQDSAEYAFTGDIGPLLSGGQEWNMKRAVAAVSNQLIARLPGDPWAPLSTD